MAEQARTPSRSGRGLASAALACALLGAPITAGAPTFAAPAAAVVAPAVSPAGPYAATIADARAAAAAVVASGAADSLSVALVDGDRVAWQEGFGDVDGRGTPPAADTRLGLGSVSKMLVTVAVLQLVDAGRVSLDAPVVRYVPDFSMADPGYRQITVRMLLDHSAGLPGGSYANSDTTGPYPGYGQDVLAGLRTERLKTTPGAMSVYCNDCFTLAGVLVERVSGQPYPDYVHDAILAPLGMAHTGYATEAFPPGSYAPALAEGSPLPQQFLNAYAAGGAWSTPADMARLAAMLMNGGTYRGRRLLSAAAVAAMGTEQVRTTLTLVPVSGLRYGLGWDDVHEPGLAAVGVRGWVKGGDSGQYHAALTLVPGQRLAAVVLGAGLGYSSEAAQALAQQVLMRALVERGRLRAMPEPLGAVTLPRVPPTKAQLAEIAGTYLGSEFTVRLTVQADRTLLMSQLHDGDWVPGRLPLSLRTDGSFWSTGLPAVSVRAVTGWGRHYLVLRRADGYGHYRTDTVLGQRVPEQPLPSAWSARLGRTWLLANEIPISTGWQDPALHLQEIPGLSGTLLVDRFSAPVDPGAGPDLAAMPLQVPTMAGRDLGDLVVLHRDGQEWMRFGGTVLRPLDGVPDLAEAEGALPGAAIAVPIGAEGYAEWRRVPDPATLRLRGATSWRLFDADLNPLAAGVDGAPGGDAISAPAGALLVVFAGPGTTVSVLPGPAPDAA